MTGLYTPVCSDRQMMAYIRQAEGHTAYLVVLNFSHRPCYFAPGNIQFRGSLLLDTFPEQEQQEVSDRIDLSGDEGLVVRLKEWKKI